MLETNITRRRAVQGAGAIGLAGVIGTSTVVADQHENGADDMNGEEAALRVVHASPDAPNVDVYATAVDDGDDDVEEDNGNDEDGVEEDDGNDEPLVEDLGFRDVTDYIEVDPGTYQVRIVSADDDGFLEDVFGDDDEEMDEETDLFNAEVELSEGMTYTTVAFGELAYNDAADFPEDEVHDPEDVGVGDNDVDEDDELDNDVDEEDEMDDDVDVDDDDEMDDEVDVDDDDEMDSDVGETDRSFQVALLEDDLSAPGSAGVDDNDDVDEDDEMDDDVDVDDDDEMDDDEIDDDVDVDDDDEMDDDEADMSRVRIFHAVPDVDIVSISSIDDDAESEDDENGLFDDDDDDEADVEDDDVNGVDDNGADDGNGAADGTLIEELAFGEFDSFEVESGDYMVEIRSTADTAVGDDDLEDDEFEDEEAEDDEFEDDEVEDDETTDNGENVREVELSLEGGVVYSGFALGYFAPEQVGDDDDDDDDNGLFDNDDGEEFELVTVEDSQDGERSDGGTGEGLLSVAPASQD